MSLRAKLLEGGTVWPAVDPKGPSPWLWNARQDLLWIAGVGSLLFALVAVPITFAVPSAGSLLVVAFLHAAVLCNYPHYAVTYRLIVDERGRARSSYRWLLATTPLVFVLVAAGAARPALIGPLVRVYLTWSAYHYAAQHFGIAAMYQARERRPLVPREKRALQVGFVAVAVHLMVLINMFRGLGTENMFGSVSAGGGLLPSSAYPFAAASALVGVIAYVLAEVLHKARTDHGLGTPARVLFAANFVWFVLPFVHLPGRDVPWGGAALAEWVPFALPFFHCAQYLGVCGFRARTAGPMRPAFYSLSLVAGGLLLFEATTRSLPYMSAIDYDESLMLVPAVINIHHFFLDGLMWKTRRQPTASTAAAKLAPKVTSSKAA
jgi:hypothetical protein